MINTIVKYAWFLTIIIFSSALLTLDDHIELVGAAVFYIPAPMLVLGLFVSIPESKKIRMTLIVLSSIGLVAGTVFTLFAMNSGGAQAGVGIFLAMAVIGGIYVASVLCIFVGLAAMKGYSSLIHSSTQNPIL